MSEISGGRDVFSDAEARYAAVCERRDGVYLAWEELGRPLTSTGSMGQLIEHPLVKQMNELDRLATHLGEAVKRKHAGPDPQAVVRASVGKSPAAKLRAVK